MTDQTPSERDPDMDYERRDAMLDVVARQYVPAAPRTETPDYTCPNPNCLSMRHTGPHALRTETPDLRPREAYDLVVDALANVVDDPNHVITADLLRMALSGLRAVLSSATPAPERLDAYSGLDAFGNPASVTGDYHDPYACCRDHYPLDARLTEADR